MCFLIVLGSLFSLSSVSWLGVWRGLELNMLCFLPVVCQLSRFYGVDRLVKYFLVQSLGSVGVLFGGLCIDSGFLFFVGHLFVCVLFFSLLLKLGVFPFHWWLPGVLSGFR